MCEIVFTSVLGSAYQEELEKLLYFNPNQENFTAGILKSIEHFGKPMVKVVGDHLRVRLESS